MQEKQKTTIGILPNGDPIHPDEGLNLDNIQEVDDFVCKKRQEFEDSHVKCHHCGSWILKEDADVDSLNNEYCPLCFDEHCHTCGDCNETFHEDDMTRVGGKWFCREHAYLYRSCADCGQVHRRRDMYPCEGTYICSDCFEDDYSCCAKCGCVVRNDYAEEHRGSYYCQSCKPSKVDFTSVLDYHDFEVNCGEYSPRRVINDKDDVHNNLLLGVELEVDNEYNYSEFDTSYFDWWFNQDNLVHFERDESLSKCGVECITQPCTLKFHQQKMRWNELCAQIVDQGFKSHDTAHCGLHVHMSRRGLTAIQIIKMDVFINRGVDFWSQIGRRRNIYCGSYDVYKIAKKSKGFQGTKKNGWFGWCRDSRYTPVNTNNQNTVEIRIFKGTLNPETILGTLEMLDALPRFLDTIPICEIYETRKIIAKYIRYIADNYHKYPNAIPMMRRLVLYEWDKMIEKIYTEYTQFNNDNEI